MVDGFYQLLSTINHPPLQIGGGERDRTDDPLRARQVLSQLSYTPGKPVDGLWLMVYGFYHRLSSIDYLLMLWWAWMDLNHRPHDYQSCALAS